MTSRPRRGLALVALGLLGGLLVAAGVALLRDEPGLHRELFALDAAWRGEPRFADLGLPRVDAVADLPSPPVLFSVRWRGWLWVEEAGRHRLTLRADDAGYLELDGRRLLDATGPPGERRLVAGRRLTRGLHAIEIGLAQLDGEAFLAVEWARRGGEPEALPAAALYPRRPGRIARGLREATSGLPLAARRLLGAGLGLLGLLALGAAWRRLGMGARFVEAARRGAARTWARLPGGLAGTLRSRRLLYAAFFAALFAVAWGASLRWAAATFGGDDAAYISASQFGPESLWYFDRMVHVYLLKIFIAIFGDGDSYWGSQVYGAFVFAATLTALAVAVRHLGPRLQLRTLAVTLFLLFSQKAMVGGIGIAFADATAMMFVTVALAVYLAARGAEPRRPRREWHALLLGALALAAVRSKLTAAVVLYLPALMVFAEGRLDLRRFARRMAWFLGGVAASLLLLMTADAIWQADFWWSLRPENLRGLGVQLRPSPEAPFRPERGWIDVLFPPGARGLDLDLAVLWLLALAAPFVAATRRQPVERRLLLLFPGLFLLAMIVLYARLFHPLYTSRMLVPILPAACLAGGSVFLHLGLERVRWSELLAPRALVPLTFAATVICLVVAPYVAGELDAGDLVPAGWLARGLWEAGHFVRAVAFPAAALAALLAAALGFDRRRVRLAVLLVATAALLGGPFWRGVRGLERRSTAQASELLLYPWRAFAAEIEAARPATIQVSPDVKSRLRMLGPAHPTVAHIAFGRNDLRLVLDHATPRDADLAIGSRDAFNRWRAADPGLAATATFDPSGLLVLVRPGDASR